MAKMVNELTGNDLVIVHVERRDWDVKTRLLSSIGKAERLLDYRTQTGFEDGLRMVHK